MAARTWRAVALTAVAVLATGLPTTASASTGSGARSSVTPRGEIVTTVLFGTGRRTSRPGRGGALPRCWWSTLGDGSLEWLLAVGSSPAGRGGIAGALVDLLAGAGDAALEQQVVQAQRCGGRTTGRFRLVPAPDGGASVLTRSMVTRLPPPDPTFSPPADAPVLVGAPVFVSFAPAAWQPVHATLTVGPLTAEVEATPRSFRVLTGDPEGTTTTCDGPSHPFDPDDPRSPDRQAGLADRCTVRFATPTGPGSSSGATTDAGTADRPARWTGTVTVLWSARWRLGTGPWQDLGLVPRTRVTGRAVREATTAIEAP